MQIVIGPTPPGTGVIAEARSLALSKSISPHSLPFGNRLMPTSITTAPGLIQSPRTNPGFADGDDDNIGPADFVAQARGARMTDRHRGVFLEQHQRHRLADDIAAADDHGVFSFGIAVHRFEQFHHAERRARPEPVAAEDQIP